MSSTEEAKQKVRAGELDKARSILLEAAAGPNPDLSARRAFEELFPLTKQQREWMAGTLMKLVSKDAAARAKAANEVGRAVRSEMSYAQQDKIGDPRCLDYLIPAMDSQDTKVVENVTPAVARAALFYYRDWRAWESGVRLLNAKKPLVRRWAVAAVTYLGREQAVEHILPLLTDKAELVSNEAGIALVWLLRSGHISASGRQNLAVELGRRLPDYPPARRGGMARFLAEINEKEAIEPLQTALKAEPDESVREYMRHAIRCLEAGDPSLPM